MSTHCQKHLCTMKQEQGKRTDSRELERPPRTSDIGITKPRI